MAQISVYAPIILFTYNRSEYTERVLASINSARGANKSELFIFSDAAASDEYSSAVKEVRGVIDKFIMEMSVFRNVTVFKAETNIGLANSIINGVTQIIRQYGRVIVLEDDLIVSENFIEYMNCGLDYYANNQSIWALSGYTFPMKALDSYSHDIYLAMRGSSWGWATWLDRWETVDWEVSDYGNIKFNWKRRLDFGRWGRDMPFMLDANVYGFNHSWAIRWCYSEFKQKKYTVYPKVSMVFNTGTDGSGTNFKKPTNKYDTKLSIGTHKTVFENVEPDRKIEREFRWKIKNKLGFIRDHYKWLFYKIMN